MLKIAWRNLWRNRTRTLIIVLAISASYALMLVSLGLSDAAHRKMEEAAVRTAGGSILIHGDGYWDSQASDALIDDLDAVLAAITGVEGVERALPRVLVLGLVNSPRGASGVRLSGIDPRAEVGLVDLEQYLVDGTFLNTASDLDGPLVLGRGIVDDLEVELGDRVVLTATDPEGELVRALFHLTGVLETGTQAVDDAMAFTTLSAAQQAVGLGQRVTQIGLLLDQDRRRHAIRDAIAARLGEAAVGLEILTWDEAIPEMVGAIEVDDAFFYIYAIVIFVVVGFGIANTFMMSVMERVRELGLLSAIGLTPRRTLQMLLCEAFLLALLSLAIGFTIGFAIHLYLRDTGLDLAEIYGMDIEFAGITMDDMFIRSEIRPIRWIVSTVGVFCLVVVTALYPALRAIRLEPAEAMRTIL